MDETPVCDGSIHRLPRTVLRVHVGRRPGVPLFLRPLQVATAFENYLNVQIDLHRTDPVCFYLIHVLCWFLADWILIHVVQVFPHS